MLITSTYIQEYAYMYIYLMFYVYACTRAVCSLLLFNILKKSSNVNSNIVCPKFMFFHQIFQYLRVPMNL